MNDLKNMNLPLLYEVRKDALIKSKNTKHGERLFAMMYYMDRLIRAAGKEGLLALEEAAKEIPPETEFCQEIQTAVSYVCDGFDAEDLTEILTARYWVKAPQGEEALLHFMIILSMLRIWEGASPYLLERLLVACLPDETAKKYRAYKKQNSLEKHERTPMEALLNNPPNIGEGGIIVIKRILEDNAAHADENVLKNVVHAAKKSDLVISLKGLSIPARKKIFSVMPDHKAEEYAGECEDMGPVRQIDIMAAMSELIAAFENR